MEPLPDLGSLSDAELKQLIRDLIREEREVSFRRRILHGKIDILRAELVARLQREHRSGEAQLEQLDLDRLTAIIASKAPPPTEEELA